MIHRTQPPRTPSARNQEIHAAVKIRGCRQADVAGLHKLTQSRVSRIVAEVEAWRGTSAAAEDQPSRSEYRRHERWLARQRYEELYLKSLHELAASHRTLTSERSGSRDGKDFAETTKREQATSVQWLKTAMRAAENLLRLSELDALPPPQSHAEQAAVERDQAVRWLTTARQNASSHGRVPTADDIHQFVDRWLAEFLGEPLPEETPKLPLRQRLAQLAAARRAAANPPTPPTAAPSSFIPPPSSFPAPPSHMPHKPPTNIPPAADLGALATPAPTPSPETISATAAHPCAPPSPPPSEQEIPPHMPPPPNREPWKDEYEAHRESHRRAHRTIVLPHGIVVPGPW